MKLFSNAGFSLPSPPTIWTGINTTSIGPRTSLALNDTAPWIRRLAEDVIDNCRDQTAMFIIGGWAYRLPNDQIDGRGRVIDTLDIPHLANQCEQLIHDWRNLGGRDDRLWIEFGNEIDITRAWKRNLRGYHDAALVCYNRIRDLSEYVHYSTGSVSNFRKRSLPWQSYKGRDVLERFSRMTWPIDTYQGLHPYRNNWYELDLDALRDLLGGRKVAITEMGWASGTRWTDDKIAELVHDEIELWLHFGSACYVHYQIMDGAKPNNIESEGYGAYTSLDDGFEPKPVQPVLAKWRGEL